MYFRVHRGSIRSEEIIQYLEQLMKHIEGHIVILWDGLPQHRSAAVKEFVGKHADRLTVFRLPPYCPDFNPVELLWADIKWNRMKGFCPESLCELKNKLRNVIRGIRKRPDILASFYAASSLPLSDDD